MPARKRNETVFKKKINRNNILWKQSINKHEHKLYMLPVRKYGTWTSFMVWKIMLLQDIEHERSPLRVRFVNTHSTVSLSVQLQLPPGDACS